MGFLSGITSFVKEHSEVIHGVLDVAGFIPGVGAVADLANAGLYAAEGDYLNAGLSLVSAIPGIGDTVALAKKSVNAIKGGLKSLKGLKNVNALKKAKGIKKALAGMRGKAKTGASNLKRGMKNADEMLDTAKNEIKEICTNGKCFTGDTLVCTRQGYKTINEIQKGDEIYSRNAETGETGIKEVEEVFHTTAYTIYHVWVDGKEEFRTTAYHPFYIKEQGWVTAINLREGDTIETIDGFAHITRVVKTRHEKAVSVYNFHVKDWKSYFVGKANCYVHNGIGKHPENLENINVNYSDMMYKNLKSWANDEADRLSKISKRQREKFNTASIVYDKSTGKCYYGRNNGICINNKFKNPILFGTDKKKGLLPKKSFNRYAVGNCAEVDAVNNVLNVGAKLESLYMSTIHTTKSSFGCLKSACENCTYIFKGKIIENFAG